MSRYSYVWSSGLSYEQYLQAKEFVDKITDAARESGSAVRMEISRQTREIIASRETLKQENIRLRESLTEGFETLSYELQDISAGISELNARFHWGFSQVIAGIGRMNDTLAELIKVAKTPAQNAAYEQYEIARDAFRKGLYPESLKAVEKAIATYELDWRFHQLKGALRMGSVRDQSLMDLGQAEESFLLAARYAKTDYREDAARAFLAAGWAAYCQGKLKEALEHTKQAITIRRKLGEAYFQAAKVYMALNEVNNALPALGRAVSLDADYVLKAAADGDFQRHEDELRQFFKALQQETYQKCASLVQQALEEVRFWLENSSEAISDKRVQKTVQRLKTFIAEGEKWPLLDLLAWERRQMNEWITKLLDARPWWWKSAESLAEYQAALEAELAKRRAEVAAKKEQQAQLLAEQRERERQKQVEKQGAVIGFGLVYGLLGYIVVWMGASVAQIIYREIDPQVFGFLGAFIGFVLGAIAAWLSNLEPVS
ncbi:MAG: hypothetical protein QW376_08960 [Candidatus Caldarchaeum sp.]